MTHQELINRVEKMSGGTYKVDSIFLFQDNPNLLPAFLHIANRNSVIIVFENENETFEPKTKTVTEDSSLHPVKIMRWMTYLRMNSMYMRNYVNFLVKQNSILERGE